MSFAHWVSAVLTVLLLAYLIYALIKAENF
jgi:K+-transporting ATPase KdpF subunit